jgi:hypothetical protein
MYHDADEALSKAEEAYLEIAAEVQSASGHGLRFRQRILKARRSGRATMLGSNGG